MIAGKEPVSRNYGLKFTVLIITFLVVLVASFLLGRYSVDLISFFRIIGWKILDMLQHVSWMEGIGFIRDMQVEKSWEEAAETVLFQIRIPRILAAALIGAALSVAGVAYQGMFRNPMVSPDILGASSGAGFGAAMAILLGASYVGISMSAFVFGLVAVFIAYTISRFSKTNQTLGMILAGMMMGALFSAGTSFVKLVADTEQTLPAITYWLMGSLNSIKPEDTTFIIFPIVLGAIPLFLLRWRINLMTVGEEEARAMGINTTAMRLVVVICATLLTAASVSVSGMIGWIGLVIPHFCRMIFGYDYRRLIPASALFGAAFLIVVDDASRLLTTASIPIGILTAFIGAPLFMYLILTGGALRRDH
ncbi:MAG: FecCD family ABC transporter permease [Anaerovoracaceae bacterium]|jgi:iron complex transport system permease protein